MDVVGIYCKTVLMLLGGTVPAFQPLNVALGASRTTQQSAAKLLLHVGLPTLHSAFTEDASLGSGGGSELMNINGVPYTVMGGLVDALGMPILSTALHGCLHQPGRAALVQYAAGVVLALPVTRPAGVGPEDFMQTHAETIRLLARLCC